MEENKEGLFSNVWTIPNLLSFIRILLIPLFAYLFYKGELIWAVVVLALSGLSDFFDGKIARRFHQVSALGKLLDPVADKLTQATIAVMLFFTFYKAEHRALHLFSWVFLLFIVKELVMLIGGALMLHFGIRPGAAEIYGKAATMGFYLVMIFIMAFGPEVGAFRASGGGTYPSVYPLFTIPDSVMMVLVVICVIMTFVAFFSYMPETHRQVKERFSPEGKAKFQAEKEKKAAEKAAKK